MTGQSGNDSHSQNRHPYRFYWLTGGLAAILAAVIGTSLAHSSSGPASNPSSSFATSSPTSPSGISPPALRQPTPTNLIRWQGDLRLTYYGKDFDDIPPQEDDPVYNTIGFIPDSRVIEVHTWAHGAIWQETSLPTKQQCSDLIATSELADQEKSIPARAGLVLCVKTFAGGRIGFARVMAVDTQSATVQAVIWE
jgi:hypothetical protein